MPVIQDPETLPWLLLTLSSLRSLESPMFPHLRHLVFAIGSSSSFHNLGYIVCLFQARLVKGKFV